MKSFFLTVIFIFIAVAAQSESKLIAYTMEDRDRMIRLEENLIAMDAKFESKFDSQNAKFEAKFDAQNKLFEAKFDSLKKQMYFTNNLIMTMIASLIGPVDYMWWDRNRAHEPIKMAIEEEKRKTQSMLNMLKEYANVHPEFKSIFDRAAIL